MTRGRFVAIFAAAAAAAAAFFYSSFFANLASTLSDWSGFGVVSSVQLYHNFLSGRPFQYSIYATQGWSVGFVDSPYAFINAMVIHVNFTHYLFAHLWGLRPTVGFLYGILIAWNLALLPALAYALIRRLDPREAREKGLFVAAVILGGGLLGILNQYAQPLLFAGPLLAAGHLAFVARSRSAFAASFAALCMLSEDSAMIALLYAAYLVLFEEGGRRWGAWLAAGSTGYIAVVLFVIQPATRAELTLTTSTTTALVLGHVARLTPSTILDNLLSLMPVAPLLAAFPLAAALFGAPPRRSFIKIGALAVVPAAAHWGECLVVGGAHHVMPLFASMLLALATAAALGRGRPAGRIPAAAWIWAAVFALASLRAVAANMPNAVRPALFRLAGRQDKAERLARLAAQAESSNKDVVRTARSIPKDRSLVYLVNNTVTGYLADRQMVWEFPDYLRAADYVLVQKDAIDLNFYFDAAGARSLDEALSKAEVTNERDRPLSPAAVELIRKALVGGGTHSVEREDEHVLLLRNERRRIFIDPPSTWGFGWLRNVGRRGKVVPYGGLRHGKALSGYGSAGTLPAGL